MKQLKIIRGIPGSGKSTWIADHIGVDFGAQLSPPSICSADNYFMVDGEYKFDPEKIGAAHQDCYRRFLAAIQDDRPLVVVDNTNTQTWEMSPYVLAGEAHGYEVEVIEIACDPKVAAKRNVHGVPAKAVEAMAARMKDQVLPWWKSRVVVSGAGTVGVKL